MHIQLETGIAGFPIFLKSPCPHKVPGPCLSAPSLKLDVKVLQHHISNQPITVLSFYEQGNHL